MHSLERTYGRTGTGPALEKFVLLEVAKCTRNGLGTVVLHREQSRADGRNPRTGLGGLGRGKATGGLKLVNTFAVNRSVAFRLKRAGMYVHIGLFNTHTLVLVLCFRRCATIDLERSMKYATFLLPLCL